MKVEEFCSHSEIEFGALMWLFVNVLNAKKHLEAFRVCSIIFCHSFLIF